MEAQEEEEEEEAEEGRQRRIVRPGKGYVCVSAGPTSAAASTDGRVRRASPASVRRVLWLEVAPCVTNGSLQTT